jgi:hypothetical protein
MPKFPRISSGTFTPTVTLVGGAGNTTPVYTTNSGTYQVDGKRCYVDVTLTGDGGAEGAGTGVINIALPVTGTAPAVASDFFPCGYAYNGAAEYDLYGAIDSPYTTISLRRTATISTTANFAGVDQNSVTRAIRLKFWYSI